jgi:ABC-type phosphate transport system substrate-binding protein
VLFALWLFLSPSSATQQELFANGYVLEKKVSHSELVDIFTRKKLFWSAGKKIVVFTRPVDSIEHKLFVMDILKMSPYKYRSLLDAVVFAGDNTPVIEVASDEEMLIRLSMTPYSIGYVKDDVYANHNNLNIIRIDYD